MLELVMDYSCIRSGGSVKFRRAISMGMLLEYRKAAQPTVRRRLNKKLKTVSKRMGVDGKKVF